MAWIRCCGGGVTLPSVINLIQTTSSEWTPTGCYHTTDPTFYDFNGSRILFSRVDHGTAIITLNDPIFISTNNAAINFSATKVNAFTTFTLYLEISNNYGVSWTVLGSSNTNLLTVNASLASYANSNVMIRVRLYGTQDTTEQANITVFRVTR